MTGETEARQTPPPEAAPVDAWFDAVAQEPAAKPYRRHGDEKWTPGADGPIVSPAEQAARRRPEFDRLRGEGVRIPEASARVGIATATGYKYEHDRKARLAGNKAAAGEP